MTQDVGQCTRCLWRRQVLPSPVPLVTETEVVVTSVERTAPTLRQRKRTDVGTCEGALSSGRLRQEGLPKYGVYKNFTRREVGFVDEQSVVRGTIGPKRDTDEGATIVPLRQSRLSR